MELSNSSYNHVEEFDMLEWFSSLPEETNEVYEEITKPMDSFGPSIEANEVHEEISTAVSSIPQEQVFELTKKMNGFSSSPEETNEVYEEITKPMSSSGPSIETNEVHEEISTAVSSIPLEQVLELTKKMNFLSEMSDEEIDLMILKGNLIQSSMHLKSLISTIKTKIENNYVEMKKINEERKKSTYGKNKQEDQKGRRLSRFLAPYFRDSRGFYPPPNPVTVEKQNRGDIDAYMKIPLSWYEIEQNTLTNIVSEVAINSVITPFQIRLDFLRSKLEQFTKYCTATVLKTSIQNEIKEIKKEISSIKNMSITDILNHPDCKLDWLLISGKLNKAGYDRCPDSCEKMWRNALCPLINKERFTDEEDKKLKLLAKQYNEKNWTVIAEELGTKRTAVQCFTRYQSHLNKKIIRQFFTPEEDDKLADIIQQCSIGDYVNWDRVLYLMPGRTIRQIKKRWDQYLKPQSRDYEWTIEEDAVLMLAVAFMKSTCWKKISSFIKGRTRYYCRERYTKVLDPQLVWGNWSAEEDRQLLILLSQYGEKWATISHYMPQRNGSLIRARLLRIKRWNCKIYKDILREKTNYNFKHLPKELMAPVKINPPKNTFYAKLRHKAFKCAKAAAIRVCPKNLDFPKCQNFQDLGNKINEIALEKIAEEILPKIPFESKRSYIKYIIRNQNKEKQEDEVDEDEIDEVDEDAIDEVDEDEIDEVDEDEIDEVDEDEIDEVDEDEIDEVDEDEIDEVDEDELDEVDEDELDEVDEDELEEVVEDELNEVDKDEELKNYIIKKTSKKFKNFDLKTFQRLCENRLLPCALIGYWNYIPVLNLRDKEQLEYSSIMLHFCDAFHVPYEVKKKNYILRKVNYLDEVPKILNSYVLLNPSETVLPFIPFNITTSKAILSLVLSKASLQSWVEKNTSKSYKIYESIIICKLCSKCKTLQGSETNENSSCICVKIKYYKKRRDVFLFRFLTVFSFAVLAHQVSPSKTQIQTLIIDKDKSKNFQNRALKRKNYDDVDDETEACFNT